jgi:hypothetical protein
MSQTLENLRAILRGYKFSRALAVALTSGILQAIHNETSLNTIAASTGLLPPWTQHLLTCLSHADLVEHTSAGWVLTSAGIQARDDQTLNALAVYHLHCFEAWLALPDRCRTDGHHPGFHQQAIKDENFRRGYMLTMDGIARQNIPWLTNHCHFQGNILDVAAGPSTFCRTLSQTYDCRVTAVDLPQIVDTAQELFHYPDHFTWIKSDFRHYQPDQPFDCIFASHILEYIGERNLLHWFLHLKQFSKPGGRMAFVSFLKESHQTQQPEIDLFELSTGLNGHTLGFIPTIQELTQSLTQAGAFDILCIPSPGGPSYREYLTTCRWN